MVRRTLILPCIILFAIALLVASHIWHNKTKKNIMDAESVEVILYNDAGHTAAQETLISGELYQSNRESVLHLLSNMPSCHPSNCVFGYLELCVHRNGQTHKYYPSVDGCPTIRADNPETGKQFQLEDKEFKELMNIITDNLFHGEYDSIDDYYVRISKTKHDTNEPAPSMPIPTAPPIEGRDDMAFILSIIGAYSQDNDSQIPDEYYATERAADTFYSGVMLYYTNVYSTSHQHGPFPYIDAQTKQPSLGYTDTGMQRAFGSVFGAHPLYVIESLLQEYKYPFSPLPGDVSYGFPKIEVKLPTIQISHATKSEDGSVRVIANAYETEENGKCIGTFDAIFEPDAESEYGYFLQYFRFVKRV